MRVPPKVEPQTDADQSRRARRAERFAAREVLHDVSKLKRVRVCGVKGVKPGGSVTIRATGTGAERRGGFGGLSTCGSVWSCPCCATKVLAGRQDELQRALLAWTAGGGKVAMLTLTMRHHDGQKLTDLWDALSFAWNRVTSGRAWGSTQDTYGAPTPRVVTSGRRKGQTVVENRVGWVRVVETTHGPNGWHVHVHVALLLPSWTTPRDVDNLGCLLFQRWRDALVHKGMQAPLARHGGLHAKLWDGASGVLSDYFTKNEFSADVSAAALELARGDLKTARAGHRTPFRILADFLAFGVVDDLDLWHEWESGSHGRRQMTWSQGLRSRLLPDVEELTDEELAEQDQGGEDVAVLTSTGWRSVRRLRCQAQLLDLVEADDTGDALIGFLVDHGIEWARPPR
jgi:hypothetical protein